MKIKNKIPKFWPTKKLGEVAYFQEGPGLRTFQFKPSGIRVINVANVQDGFLDLIETKYLDPKEIKEKYQHFLVNEGDILLSTSGTIGRVARVRKEDLPLMLNTSVMRLRSLNENTLLNQFLFYFLNTESFKKTLLSYKTGVAIFNVGPSHLKRIWLTLPPLPIQHQIVERLDAIKKAQELSDKQIALAEDLFRSLLHKELDSKGKNWEVKKIGDIVEVTSSKRIFQSEYIIDGIPFYRTKEIVELSQNKPISLELFISEKRFDEINKKFGVPQKGDILISAVGTIGISWVVPDRRKFYFKDGNLLWIKNFNGIDSYYLKLVLDNIFKSISQLAAGAAYNALTIIKLKKIKIPVPPLKTQRQIVEKLQAAQDYKKKLLEQKQKLQELFSSCLDKAMKGELVN